MKMLVTGGGGFLGSRIATMLHERGDQVTVLGRHSYPHLEKLGIQTVQADIRDRSAILQACKDRDVLFHTAAIPGMWGDRKLFWETNVGGTRNMVEACKECGVSKLVFTSSPSVVFGEEGLCGVNELCPYPVRYLAHYPETKAAAEKLVLEANGSKLATVALRPHLIWGPGDPHLIPRIIDRAKRHKLVQIGDGQNLVDIVYIDNAAEAHLLAADRLYPGSRCSGKPYFIAQEKPVLLWFWIRDLLKRLGLPPIKRSMSLKIAKRVGAGFEWFYGLLRISHEPPLTRFVAAQLGQSHYFDQASAQQDLGYFPRVNIEEGLTRTVASFSTSI